jgi:type I restriction enzyme S subunit
LIGPLLDRFLLNERQSRTLADLRDTLLPKLISGEIHVPEAEETLEEAV